MWRSEVLQNDCPLLHIFIFVTFRKTVQEKHLNIGQNDSGYSGQQNMYSTPNDRYPYVHSYKIWITVGTLWTRNIYNKSIIQYLEVPNLTQTYISSSLQFSNWLFQSHFTISIVSTLIRYKRIGILSYPILPYPIYLQSDIQTIYNSDFG